MHCALQMAFESARDLDNFMQELDRYFPNGAWEQAISKWIIPQEEWESLKYPYCEYAKKGWWGGTGHRSAIIFCIYEENNARIESIFSAICSWTTGFPDCPIGKPGGELPNITAIPITPAP